MTQPDRLPLGQQMLRGAGIGQAIVAFPICLFLGASAYEVMLEERSHWLVYYFFRDSCSAIMAAGIIFSVYVQRKAVISAYQYLLFEWAKSLLATGLWLWLILDAAFGPWLKECRSSSYVRPCDVSGRVIRAALASVVLLVIFYPALVYSYLVREGACEMDEGDGGVSAERGEASERSRLLG